MKGRGQLLIMILSCWLSACLEIGAPAAEEPAPAPVESHYVIPAGQHNATTQEYEPLEINSLSFEAMFDSSAIYTTKEPLNQGDINKLMGLSDCSSHHQLNSARFGWRWYNNALQIWAYTYLNGERSSKYLGDVQIGAYYSYAIRLLDDTYIFTLDKQEVRLPRVCKGIGSGYKLFPYFGGDETAPQQIVIWLRKEVNS